MENAALKKTRLPSLICTCLSRCCRWSPGNQCRLSKSKGCTCSKCPNLASGRTFHCKCSPRCQCSIHCGSCTYCQSLSKLGRTGSPCRWRTFPQQPGMCGCLGRSFGKRCIRLKRSKSRALIRTSCSQGRIAATFCTGHPRCSCSGR